MDRSEEHARATAELVTKMDPAFFSALTVTIVGGTPLSIGWQDPPASQPRSRRIVA